MNRVSRLIYRIFFGVYPVMPPGEEDTDRIVREVVGEASRGNVNLQFGYYFTENDVEKMRQEIKSYPFISPVKKQSL